MKLKYNLLVLAALAGLPTLAHAQAVQMTLTGSTAFRSVVLDRVPVLFDAGSLTANTSDPNKLQYSYSGTMSNTIPGLTSPVLIRTDFSGSASGMLAVKNGTILPCINVDGTPTNCLADLACSDVFPSSAVPAIPQSSFSGTNAQLGVVGFVFFKNTALTGITNITREQAVLLMTATDPVNGGMPASFLGGTGAHAADNLALIGRDSGSGSRITVEKCLGFVSSPNLWQTNGDGTYSSSVGYNSGGKVATAVIGGTDSIGYAGLADYNSVTNTGLAAALSFQGIPYSHAAVAAGMYPMWGYEHLVTRIGLSGNQTAIRNALVKAVQDANYQSTNAVYNVPFVSLSNMTVKRGTDGGGITGLNF